MGESTSVTLKRNERRTVTRSDGVVVKRYHHPDPIARLFDHERAASELEILRTLHRRGLAVPVPLEVRHRDGAWELRTEWIPGAVSLDEVLSGRAAWPAAPERIARALGRLLADAHALGLVHPDLHSGNVLVREDGRVWLVDLRRARLRRKLGPSRLVGDLVQAAAGVREAVSGNFRSRFLVAYLRALPPALASTLPERAGLARRIEAEARERRREQVEGRRLRWTRASSVCRPIPGNRPGRSRGFRAVQPPAGRIVEVRGGRWEELLEVWFSAARLQEHGLPAARPVEIVRTPEAVVRFALPEDSRPLAPGTKAPGRALEELLAALRDRGLAVEPMPDDLLLLDGRGGLVLGPLVGARLAACEGPNSLGPGLRPWFGPRSGRELPRHG